MTELQMLKVYKEMPLKGIRKFIAARLGIVWRDAVHVTLHKDVDVTFFYENRGEIKYSLIDYILYALVLTLKEDRFRVFNGHFDGQLSQSFYSVNVGLALAHPKGLLVPVVHGAEDMTLNSFVNARKELIDRAKEWKHSQGELENGTFTVTNLGMLEIDTFTPILNPPQVAILGFGRVRVESVSWSWNEAPSSRALLSFSLTIDHRILDGADAAKFLKRIETNMLMLWNTD